MLLFNFFQKYRRLLYHLAFYFSRQYEIHPRKKENVLVNSLEIRKNFSKDTFAFNGLFCYLFFLLCLQSDYTGHLLGEFCFQF